MTPIHIIGHAGCGKTTLIVDLVEELTERKISVGTLKHSAHAHELDKPGKDSFRHRKAGACPAAMMTGEMTAVYLPRTKTNTPDKLIETYFKQTDIVLIEGWISGPYDKIEIWRGVVKHMPLFPGLKKVKALVTDDALPSEVVQDARLNEIDCLKRSDASKLADFVMGLTSG